MEMRHGALELSKLTGSLHKLEELLVSSEGSGFERFMMRGEELDERWRRLTELVDHRDVRTHWSKYFHSVT